MRLGLTLRARSPRLRPMLRSRSTRLGPTLRTARHLRPEQLLARTTFLAERRLAAARPRLLPRLSARRLARILPAITDAASVWRWPPAPLDPAARARVDRVDDLIAGRYTFLNETRATPEGASRQWQFQFHGFSYAVDLAVAARRGRREAASVLRQHIEAWLEAHPVSPTDAWHPFVVSERLLAWLVVRDILPDLKPLLREPILLHAVYLDRHLEVDVGGNHLLKNLVALLVAGCAFDGPAPTAWRTHAARRLRSELRRQVLPDGGHYERSPMYHLLVLADLLTALFPAGRRELPISVELAHAVRRMQRVAASLVHPDGEIPLFNDSVLGEAPHPSQLIGPSTDPTEACLPATGYALLRVGDGVLIADCGAPGPDDLPAHVHADALSFELSIGQQRVLVDGGVFNYAAGPLRDRLRGTAAHNTVTIDDADQSEVWGSFRVGRRARVRLLRCTDRLLLGVHDGYARLGARHERRIDAVEGVGWRILDIMTGRGAHTADARLRLHPSLRWRQDPAGRWLACTASGAVVLEVHPIGKPTLDLEAGVYAERFNQLQDIDVLRLRRAGELPHVSGCWLLLPGAQPVVV